MLGKIRLQNYLLGEMQLQNHLYQGLFEKLNRIFKKNNNKFTKVIQKYLKLQIVGFK